MIFIVHAITSLYLLYPLFVNLHKVSLSFYMLQGNSSNSHFGQPLPVSSMSSWSYLETPAQQPFQKPLVGLPSTVRCLHVQQRCMAGLNAHIFSWLAMVAATILVVVQKLHFQTWCMVFSEKCYQGQNASFSITDRTQPTM